MIKDYRHEIDIIDEQLLALLQKRLETVDKIGRYKRRDGLPLFDESREREALRTKCSTDAERRLLSALMDIAKTYQKSCFNIYLIGMPYSGKSTVLKSILTMTDRACIDTDSLVEQRENMSIPEIFGKYGETYFRDAESTVLRECAEKGSSVVSTGGGIVLRDENIRIMKNSGIIVLCDRPLDSLRESFLQDKSCSRPLVKSIDDLELLYYERFRTYRENADICINTALSDAAEKILDFAKEKGLSV